jgi:hypothetical protein
MDLLFAGVLFSLFAFDLLGANGLLLAVGFFLFTPQFVRFAGGKGISGRKAGLLFTTVALLSFVLWMQHGTTVLLGGSVLAGAVVPTASRFGMQAYTFYSVVFAVFVSPVAILAFLGAVVLTVVVTKGWYLYVLRDHLTHVYEYATVKQYGNLYDGLKSLDTIHRFLAARSVDDFFQAVYQSILLRGLLDNPFVVPTVAGLVLVFPDLGATFDVPALLPWALTGIGLFVLISLYHMRFLGQPSRYLPYAFVPCVVLIAEARSTLGVVYDSIVALSLLAGMVTMIAHFYAYRRLNNQKASEALDDVIEQLQSEESKTIFTQPRHLGAEIAWKTGHIVADYVGERTHSAGLNEHRKLYPNGSIYLTNDIDWLRERYDPDLILFRRTDEVAEDELSMPDSAPVYENELFKLYTLDAFDTQ